MPEAQAGWRVGPAGDPDRYELIERRDGGGEAELWRGRWQTADVAVKILRARLADDDLPGWVARWNAQYRQVSHLDHRGIVRIAGCFDGPAPHPPGGRVSGVDLYLVMPWIEGVDLARWMRSDAAAGDAERCLDVLAQVAATLDYLHGRGVLHRDLSPGNVMVTPEGDARIIDFSFARPQAAADMTFVVNGGWTAPEVAASRLYTEESDRYSVGAIAFALLTRGGPPAADGSAEAAARMIRRGVDPDVARALAVMLDLDPAARAGQTLARWVAEVRRLHGRSEANRRCVGVTATVTDLGRPLLVVAVGGGIVVCTRSSSRVWESWPRPAQAGSPVVTATAACRGGNGAVQVALLDLSGRVRCGIADGHELRDLMPIEAELDCDGGLVAAASRRGHVEVYGVRRRGGLWCARLDARDPAETHTIDVNVSRVHCAVRAADLGLVLVVSSPQGEVGCYVVDDGRWSPGPRIRVAAAAATLNRWGNVELAVADTVGRVWRVERVEMEWLEPEPLDAPFPALDVAAAARRDLAAIAIAGEGGTALMLGATWTRHDAEPAVAVDMTSLPDSRFVLASASRGGVLVLVEDYDGPGMTVERPALHPPRLRGAKWLDDGVDLTGDGVDLTGDGERPDVVAAFLDISRTSRTPDSLLDAFLRELRRTFPSSPHGTILLIEDDQLVPSRRWPPSRAFFLPEVAGRACRERRALRWRRSAEERPDEGRSASLAEVTEALYAPMVVGGEVVGVICVDAVSPEPVFARSHLNLFHQVASIMGPLLRDVAAPRLPRVFISYAREERAFVARLSLDLLRRGVLPWIDTSALRVGDAWDERIADAIAQADGFLVLVSRASVASSYVRLEIERALQTERPMLPLRYERCEIPDELRRWQYVDVSDYERALSQVVARLGAVGG